MTHQAIDIIRTAARTLFDEDHVRWPLPELLDHINDAIRTVVSAKPNANTQTLTLTLQQGTLQVLPANVTIVAAFNRNMVLGSGEPGGPVAGPAIRMVDGRELMDAYFPGWQSDATLFAGTVKHCIYEPAQERQFWVIPGNDGTGKIEIIAGIMPDPLIIGGDVDLETNYAVDIPLPDEYRTMITDFVTFRAFSKDSGVPASAARAQTHLAAFQSALQVLTGAKVEISAARKPKEGP